MALKSYEELIKVDVRQYCEERDATKKQSISVEVNEDARDAFQELKDCEKLDIQIKKHREKRSLDANAYYWVLITKFAKKLELSNPEAHNMMNCLDRMHR